MTSKKQEGRGEEEAIVHARIRAWMRGVNGKGVVFWDERRMNEKLSPCGEWEGVLAL